jgi:signal transduction histidine kinase
MQLPLVKADPGALATVFRNLIENALKYTREGAKDSCITFRFRQVPKYLEILVEDNGIGVPKDAERWIFIDGFRSDNAMRRRPAGGSGIGLPHSKDLMVAMGGDLYYEHDPKVTRFVVKLRLSEEEKR